MNKRRAAVLLGLLSAAGLDFLPAAAQDKKFDTGMIPGDHILLPQDGAVKANIFLISDAGGWGDAEQQQAEALAAKGAAVVGIDFPSYIKSLSQDKGDCVYMISDVEALAHQIQRSAGTSAYALPIVAGIGEGGALALAMISQSPAATVGEAVAVDPQAGIPLQKVLCTPADKQTADGRTVYGFTDGPLPATVTIALTKDAPQAGQDHAAALEKAHNDVDLTHEEGAAPAVLQQMLTDRVDAAGNTDEPLGLPISILEAQPKYDTMAVIYSGDGGWRDLDKEVASVLQTQGIPVVGIDSLRYFWSERKPQETADDLSRIMDAYRREWNVKHVMLIGYSFGADVLPATYNLLSDKDKARVPQITLMALSRQVDYVISVEGWLGVDGEGKGGDPVKDIGRIDPKLVQCIYGTDEDEDPCPTLKDKGVESVAIEGGHHFDENYEALAAKITTALKTRLAIP